MEADLSDDEGGVKVEEEGSSEDEDTSLGSLIDNDVEVNSNDRNLLHRKFVQDEIEAEERKYREMKKKMEKKYLEEEEMLNKRMEEAAKKNQQKDKEEELLPMFNKSGLHNDVEEVSTSNSLLREQKNQDKLR